jgi:hypothetical protein
MAGQQLRFQAGMHHCTGLGAGSFSHQKDERQISNTCALGKLCGRQFSLGIAHQDCNFFAPGGRFVAGCRRNLFFSLFVPEEPRHHGRGHDPDQPQRSAQNPQLGPRES